MAYVDQDKVLAYLLNSGHPDGHSKARFFYNAGFRAHEWQRLAAALVEVGRTGEVMQVSTSDYGQRFTVDAGLSCPDERVRRVRTVWILDHGNIAPRLITAYPLKTME